MRDGQKKKDASPSADVWERFERGNGGSFKSLFQYFYPEMYGYGVKLCANRELVKDCIQDLFQYIWERRHELDHIDSPRVYLFVSLRRRILKKLKRREKTAELKQHTERRTFAAFSEEEIIIRDEVKFENKTMLKQALNQLSDRQREIIYLHFYNGMSYGEIEELLAINRQSVRNHMYRAMKTLRSVLKHKTMRLVMMALLIFIL